MPDISGTQSYLYHQTGGTPRPSLLSCSVSSSPVPIVLLFYFKDISKDSGLLISPTWPSPTRVQSGSSGSVGPSGVTTESLSSWCQGPLPTCCCDWSSHFWDPVPLDHLPSNSYSQSLFSDSQQFCQQSQLSLTLAKLVLYLLLPIFYGHLKI